MNKYICTNRNKNYQNEVEKILVSRKQEILDFFGVKDNGQFNFNIYIYNTIDDLVNAEHNLDDVLTALKQFTPHEVKFAEDSKMEDLSLFEAKIKVVEDANLN